MHKSSVDALRPGGTLWVADLVDHDTASVRDVMWDAYGGYLESLGGPSYRDEVFGYIEKEDTPRPLLEQIDIFRDAGFRTAEILHKNTTFAAFGVMK
jgi:tRNA (cmo5U34)-methyltransferase